MRVSAALPTGVARPVLRIGPPPPRAEARLAGRLEAEGFREVILPILDYLEPYEPLLTAASRAGSTASWTATATCWRCAADFTPMLARLLAPRLSADGAALALPLRLFYRGDVMRYEEERAGRQREFYQMGAELLGVPEERGRAGDAPPVPGAADGGRRREQVSVILGFAGASTSSCWRREAAPTSARGSPLAVRPPRARRGPPGLLTTCSSVLEDGAAGQPRGSRARGGRAPARACSRCATSLAAALSRARGSSIDLAEFALHEPRPAAPGGDRRQARPYYDGLVFRAYAGGSGVPVGGGGRYDRLFQRARRRGAGGRLLDRASTACSAADPGEER